MKYLLSFKGFVRDEMALKLFYDAVYVPFDYYTQLHFVCCKSKYNFDAILSTTKKLRGDSALRDSTVRGYHQNYVSLIKNWLRGKG